jgi:hypothetical protein
MIAELAVELPAVLPNGPEVFAVRRLIGQLPIFMASSRGEPLMASR